MTGLPELVVLVDNAGNPIGTHEKITVHDTNTPLHLAFSCYLLDERGRLLMTRRALSKLTWPGVWTNSFCGHPAPGEGFEEAIVRRARRELGAELTDVRCELPDFAYRAIDVSGVVENELCPVFTAKVTTSLAPAPDEVSDWKWIRPEALVAAVSAAPFAFSPWLCEQLPQLQRISALANGSRDD